MIYKQRSLSLLLSTTMAEEKSGSLANSRLSNFHETICLPLLLVCSFHFNIASTHSLTLSLSLMLAQKQHEQLTLICHMRLLLCAGPEHSEKSLTTRFYTFLHFISAREYILARDMANSAMMMMCYAVGRESPHNNEMSEFMEKRRGEKSTLFLDRSENFTRCMLLCWQSDSLGKETFIRVC